MRVKDCLFFFCMAGLLQKAAKEQDRDTACANCVPVLYGRRPIRQSSASLSRISRAEAGVLVYRTLLGLDETKNQDYRENVQYVLGGD